MLKYEMINALCLQGETSSVDFKREQYKFIKAYVITSGIVGRECIQVIEVAPCNDLRPFYVRKDLGKVVANVVYMRDGTSTALATPEQIRVMGEESALGRARPVVELPEGVSITNDWSAVIVDDADINDLDQEAIRQARKGFIESHAGRLSDGSYWLALVCVSRKDKVNDKW